MAAGVSEAVAEAEASAPSPAASSVLLEAVAFKSAGGGVTRGFLVGTGVAQYSCCKWS